MPGERDPLLGDTNSPAGHGGATHRPLYGTSGQHSLQDNDIEELTSGHSQYPDRLNNVVSQESESEVDIKPNCVHIPTTTDHRFRWKRLWAFTGPGFLMSIAYLDPGNIQSDLQSGAVAQYKLLWVLMWSTVMGLIMQLLSARLGCVTGMNLAQVCRQEYTRVPRTVLWLMTEVAIIGSDIQEVIGSAIAISLLSNHMVPLWAGVLITGVDTFTFLFLESAGLRKLEAFFGTLILTMSACFLYMFIMVKPDAELIVKGLWFPWCAGCDREAIKQLVGIVGAVIMPHNIYLHSALVLSREVDRRDCSAVKEANMYYIIESVVALFVSFLINLFIVAVFAAAFSGTDYATLMGAGEWLNDHYGVAMKVMWAVGLLAAGQSSTMTGTYAGQFVMEGFLHIHWAKWKRVVVTRSIAMVPTVIIAIVTRDKLDDMLIWLNVLQSVQLPFALLPIMHFTNSRRVMGDFRNSLVVRCVVGFIVCLITAANGYLVSLYVGAHLQWYFYLLIGLVIFIYASFLLYLAIGIPSYLKLKRRVKQCCGCEVGGVEEEMERRRHLSYPRLCPDTEPLLPPHNAQHAPGVGSTEAAA